MNFISFPSIENFHNIVKFVTKYPHVINGPLTYRGKIKLHGTNAAIRIQNGEIAAQLRTQIITPAHDNVGFAAWVETNRDYWSKIGNPGDNNTVFGEWAGKGIMKGTAINQLPGKVFAVFAIQLGDDPNTSSVIIDPDTINKLLPDRPSDIHILPWQGDSFDVDFRNRETLQSVADTLNKVIETIEPCDPWVKQVFGVEGTAEGIVYYPINNDGFITRKIFSDFTFKAKGEKHKVVKTKVSVQIDPEVAANIDGFVSMFATEPRFEQGLAAIGGVAEMKQIPAFLKWILSDIFKESEDELEASGLEWSQVEKYVQTAVRQWFIAKCKSI